ncbi:hypothetical protein FUAX_18990 [Fulvitalea axinellae]|uniref:Formylglycine-generating enzyme family protein n=1 Tax=Fulvitalea axinellae TaxID=1182444 RepID=A0AAU9CR60_9BACT|nr:hypothetical protein FUAX_18990 [Fulvitalea axinellae]
MNVNIKLWVTALLALFSVEAMAQGISETFVKKGKDWSSTMSASRKAFRQYQKSVTFRTVSSPVMGINDAPEVLEVNLSECDNLVLQADECTDNSVHDGGIFADAYLVDKKGDKHYLDQMTFIRQIDLKGKPVIIGPKQNETIYIGKAEESRGVGIYAPGEVILDLGRRYRSFRAKVGTHRKRSGVRASMAFHAKNYSHDVIFGQLKKHYPVETETFLKYAGKRSDKWLWADEGDFEIGLLEGLIAKLEMPGYLRNRLNALKSSRDSGALLSLFLEVAQVYEFQENYLKFFRLTSVVNSVEWMRKNHSEEFEFDKVKSSYEELLAKYPKAKAEAYQNKATGFEEIHRLRGLKRKILLRNPLLKDDFVAVRHYFGDKARQVRSRDLGTPPSNFSSNGSIKGFDTKYNTEIIRLSDITEGEPIVKPLYTPKKGELVNDLELDYNAGRLMFSKVGNNGRWHLHEMDLQEKKPRQVTPDTEPDLDYFEGLYLPNGKVICASNISMQGVPCVNGKDPVANLCLYDPKTKDFHQLNFGQDNEWDPVMLPNGRVMYQRWEYTDETHYFTRVLMHMNPDGTGKKEYYGSASYWPNSIFGARPLPNDPARFVGIVTGHHGIARAGRLVVFDPRQGRFEADGVVQEIPYSDRKLVPIIKDQLVAGVWPLFSTPYPLDDKYFVVTAKLNPTGLWGVYLVDMFDNVTLIKEFEDSGIREIMPLRKRKKPMVIPDKTKRGDKEATVYIQDLYEGRGTKGVPRGTIKSLRVFAYKFGYNRMQSNHDIHGVESSWDVKRILGTVPVEEDGSVMFKVPANTPISLQPLDKDGRALQLMRSWLTAMPGEVLSCVGCHEEQNTVANPKLTLASRKQPQKIRPVSGGGARPFTFDLEIQPVLDRNCISCHNGSKKNVIDLASDKKAEDYNDFRESYLNLHPFVNRPGPESDVHVLTPMEFHASTSELVQLLEKGHYGVELEPEEWEKINTWIDLNAPYHGEWRDVTPYRGVDQVFLREKLARKYNNLYDHSDEELAGIRKYLKDNPAPAPRWKVKEGGKKPKTKIVKIKRETGERENRKTVKLNDSVSMEFVRIPAGRYVTVNAQGKRKVSEIKKAYWISATEVSNAQYRSVYPDHHTRMIDMHWKDHTGLGYEANRPGQPVVRINRDEALIFAQKLEGKHGHGFDLPTAEEWEWACRAGNEGDWSFGAEEKFVEYANLADDQLRNMTVAGVNPKPMPEYHPKFRYNNFLPRAWGFDDGNLVQTEVGSYKPNAWGLFDMHGNVKEWTKSENMNGKGIVKGGSWKDRPKRSAAGFSLPFETWQKVSDVGFRLVIRE